MGGAGPSGDFEIREEDRRNELGRGRGIDAGAEPDLIGNTVDTGSSAAQLPQKNILERKEVLIGEDERRHGDKRSFCLYLFIKTAQMLFWLFSCLVVQLLICPSFCHISHSFITV